MRRLSRASLRAIAVEQEPEVRLHRRPLAVEDAENDGVAAAAVGHQLVIAQDAVLLRTEALDRRTRGMIEPVRAEFDGDAAQRLERVREQEPLAFGVDRGALRALRIPGVADLDAAID